MKLSFGQTYWLMTAGVVALFFVLMLSIYELNHSTEKKPEEHVQTTAQISYICREKQDAGKHIWWWMYQKSNDSFVESFSDIPEYRSNRYVCKDHGASGYWWKLDRYWWEK